MLWVHLYDILHWKAQQVIPLCPGTQQWNPGNCVHTPNPLRHYETRIPGANFEDRNVVPALTAHVCTELSNWPRVSTLSYHPHNSPSGWAEWSLQFYRRGNPDFETRSDLYTITKPTWHVWVHAQQNNSSNNKYGACYILSTVLSTFLWINPF